MPGLGRGGVSNACYREGKLELYRKGPALSGDPALEYIDYGISVHRRSSVLATLPDGPCPLENYCESLSRSGLSVGYEVKERLYEVGSHQGIAET